MLIYKKTQIPRTF